MEETISTTVEAPQAGMSTSAPAPAQQTTPEVTETQTTDVETTQSDVTQEPETVAEETTETESQDDSRSAEAPANAKNWEQIAKDNQASFTRVSQELAELKKQIADNKPKIVQEGKINPEFEQKYRFEVDNREYLTYDNLARQLEPEQRAVVENLMREAKGLYNPTNNTAYEAKMAQVKDYFRSDIVEGIARDKMNLLSQVKAKFDQEILADKQERAQKVSEAIDGVPELRELVYQDSENFSPEVLDIVKTMFDYTGGVDIESTQKAINKIKELGVKEYLAKQKAEEEKAKANVPTGTNVVQNNGDTLPTAEELRTQPGLYRKAVEKYGMDKVDAVIMKG